MNTILKLPPNPCTSIALSIFSDCCSTATGWPPHFRLQVCYKPNLLKNGLPRGRLHYIGCTNFEKSCTNISPTENHATGKHWRGLENSKDLDRRNQVSIDHANIVDFVNGSECLEELSGGKDLGGENLDRNGTCEVNQGSQSSGFDVCIAENAILGNGYDEGKTVDDSRELGRSSLGGKGEILGGFPDRINGDDEKNEKLGDLCDRNFGNCEKKMNLTYLSDKNNGKRAANVNFGDFSDTVAANYDSSVQNEVHPMFGNGSDRFKGIDKRNPLGGSILDESSANLVYLSDRVSDKCESAVENEMDGRYENGFDRSNTMDKRNKLGSSILDEINANLVDSSDKVSEKFDSAVGKNEDALCVKGSETMVATDTRIGEGYGFKQGRVSTNETNTSKEQFDNVVIRKLWSPFSSDPIKAKKDKGLLDDEELQKLKILENFVYDHSFDHGHLMVKLMGTEHMEDAKELLTESFAELMWGPLTYRPLLRFSITEHIQERRSFLPHAATLVGLYAEREGEWILGGTVELSFNAKGANQFPHTPTPPKRSPYLCNMAVNERLRRRGIGRHLLKASEKLVPQMGFNEMYLHCRIIDTAPFNMYTKAGYKVVQTDNIFALLTLQRRRHLMYKKLPLSS